MKVTFTGAAGMRENVSFRCMKLVNTADQGILNLLKLLCGSSLPDKFIQCPEPVAHLLPLRQQLIEDRRVCGGSTVQKHDGTRMDAAEKFFERFLLCGLLILIPVHIGETPEFFPEAS